MVNPRLYRGIGRCAGCIGVGLGRGLWFLSETWGSAVSDGVSRLSTAAFRPDGGRTFFLLRQEESSQRRRRPGVGARCAGTLRYSDFAGLRNSALRASDSPRPFSANSCVARRLPREVENRSSLRGWRLFFCLFRQCTAAIIFYGRSRAGGNPEMLLTPRIPPGFPPTRERGGGQSAAGGFPGPLRGAEQRRLAGGSRFALFEP